MTTTKGVKIRLSDTIIAEELVEPSQAIFLEIDCSWNHTNLVRFSFWKDEIEYITGFLVPRKLASKLLQLINQVSSGKNGKTISIMWWNEETPRIRRTISFSAVLSDGRLIITQKIFSTNDFWEMVIYFFRRKPEFTTFLSLSNSDIPVFIGALGQTLLNIV